MCLAIPGRVVALHPDPVAPVAEVEYGEVRRTAQLLYLPEVQVGDYVLVQAGFAMRRLSEAEAREALALLESSMPRASEPAGVDPSPGLSEGPSRAPVVSG